MCDDGLCVFVEGFDGVVVCVVCVFDVYVCGVVDV